MAAESAASDDSFLRWSLDSAFDSPNLADVALRIEAAPQPMSLRLIAGENSTQDRHADALASAGDAFPEPGEPLLASTDRVPAWALRFGGAIDSDGSSRATDAISPNGLFVSAPSLLTVDGLPPSPAKAVTETIPSVAVPLPPAGAAAVVTVALLCGHAIARRRRLV